MSHGSKPIKGVRGECRSGKLRFALRVDAENALSRAMRKGSPRRAEVRVYPCPRCDGYHLTSIPPRKIARALACPAQSPDGFPCGVPAGHLPDFPHRWESPCPDEVPSVEWRESEA